MNLRGSALAAACVLALGAGPASAITIMLGGGVYSGNFGAANTLGINSLDTVHFTSSATGTTVTGDVEASNVGGNLLLLTLTNFVFTSARSTAITLTIDICEMYNISSTIGWTGSHQFNGNVDFSAAGQSASIGSVSSHETTMLPDLLQSVTAAGPGTVPISRGQGPATNVTPVTAPFMIHNIYTITLTRGSSGTVVLNLPNSGVDQASTNVIPLPSASLSGLAGLVGLIGFKRIRRTAV